MWLTSSFLGVKKGTVDHLFFVITQDYIEDNRRIREALDPLLIKLGRDLGSSGAVVRPFPNDANKTLEEFMSIDGWTDAERQEIRDKTPALLVIESTFEDFDPRTSRYVFISLRDSMDEFGNVRVFDVQELFDLLRAGSSSGELFDRVRAYGKSREAEKARLHARRALKIEPTIAGIGLNVSDALRALKAWLKSA